ncbi:MAG: tRNA (pseudouridine(54)-N(1))-methyltransferase TrmY [Candidatus Nanohaloarchaea archaeon]|nr:tRNA (pseudouridine(54)-N(1))-methyltransferase TrmY [Candidatus Nanohaloarchaea archaeon]
MPHFIVIGHDAPTDADFSLDDLPGVGRLDLLARCVNAGLLLSHGLRADTMVSLVMQDTATVRFHGGEIGGLNPDERSIAGVIRTALQRLDGRGSLPTGVSTKTDGLEPLLQAVDGHLFMLDEDGDPFDGARVDGDATFVLSDHREFTARETSLLEEYGAESVSLGPEPLHADHAITVAHNRLDTAGAT